MAPLFLLRSALRTPLLAAQVIGRAVSLLGRDQERLSTHRERLAHLLFHCSRNHLAEHTGRLWVVSPGAVVTAKRFLVIFWVTSLILTLLPFTVGLPATTTSIMQKTSLSSLPRDSAY